MTRDEFDTFEKLAGQLETVYDELSILSKKTPNDAISKFKLGFINGMFNASNEFLGGSYRPFKDFERFDEEKIPQVGDVVFMVSQYIQAFEKLRADNVEVDFKGNWSWVFKEILDESGKPLRIRTTKPKRLRD